MTIKNKILSVISTILLTVVIIISSVQVWCFDRSFYSKEYTKANTAAEMEMSLDDLMKATDTLLDYLEDKSDSIVVEATVAGTTREVFNDRETAHMIDVKALYQHVIIIRNIAFGICVALCIYMLFTTKKEIVSLMKYGLKYGLMFVGIFLAFLGIWIISDFNGFWTTFHEILFTNDLWLLDPNTSLMINMFPSVFFSDLVIRILCTVIIILLIIGMSLNWIGRRKIV